MESHIAAAGESILPEGLSYRLPPSGTAITSKQSCSWYASSANAFSPQGATTIRINFAGTGYLHPESVRIAFTVAETGGTYPLQPASPYAGTVFSRMRVSCNGCTLEDVSYHGRMTHMLSLLWSPQKRFNDAAEGFGCVEPNVVADRLTPESIPAGTMRKVVFAPLSGFFNQPKLIPLRWAAGLCIEFDTTGTDWLAQGAAFSNNFVLSDVRAFGDLLQLDEALDNAISEHALSGKPLQIPYSSLTTQVSSPNGLNSFTLQSLRGFSRTKSVIVSFYKDLSTQLPTLTPITTLYHPHGPGAFNPAQEAPMEMWLQLAEDVEPSQHIRSLAQAYYMLRLGSGHFAGDNALAISGQDFRNQSFLLLWDLEKGALQAGLGSAFTGQSTQGGILAVVEIHGLGLNTAAAATYSYLTLHYDAIASLGLEPSVLT
jgi:hypothetical protein